MRELALFAGAGGGILGGQLLGWRCICAVEIDAYCRDVLMARQNDGSLEPFPIWDDVRTFDGTPWRGAVDVVSGGFPCQDISVAGKGAGIDGERSGLWSEFARIIGEVRPRYVFVENSPALITRGLGRVLGDLAALGYDAQWTVLGAADVGAPHQRDRLWIVANAHGEGQPQQAWTVPEVGRWPCDCGESLAHADLAQREGRRAPIGARAQHADAGSAGWWSAEPDVGRVAHGVAARVDRLRAIGNGQVPQCAAEAWRLLTA